jgi:nucleoid DNA-binding protein
MTPHKFKSFIPEIADDMGISEADLTRIVDFYYKELRQALTGLKYKQIIVEGLGKFNLKENAVRKKIDTHKNIIEHSRRDTMQNYKLVKICEEELVNLERALQQVIEDKQRMKAFYDEKNRYIKDLEEQKKDS